MAVGSELAALLEARRRKNEGDENSRSSNDNDDPDNATSSRNDAAARRNGLNGASGGGGGVGASWIKNKAETTSDTPVKQTVSFKPPVTNGPSTSHAANLKSAAASTTNNNKLAHASQPSSSSSAVPSPQHATVTRNPKLQQRMDKANSEAGIPTPDFLVEMRKNLKSNSEKRGGEIHGGGAARLGRQAAAEKSVVGGGNVGNGTANDESTRPNKLKEEQPSEDTASHQQSVDETTLVISNRSTSVDMGTHDDKKGITATTTSANSAKQSSITNSSSKTKSDPVIASPRPNVDLAARRSRLVAHRHATNTTQTAVGEKNDDNNNNNNNNNNHQSGESGNNSATAKNASNKEKILNSAQNNSNDDKHSSSSGSSITQHEGKSANVRRERILAKVRANTTLHKTQKGESIHINCSNSINSSNGGVSLEDAVGLDKKIKVTSPHAEEVEMLFADEGFVTSGSCSNEEEQQQQQQRQHTESMATGSGKNKQSSSLAIAALAANKNQSHTVTAQDSPNQNSIVLDSPGSLDETTPQKAKSHNGRRLQIHHQRLHMASTPKIRGNAQHRRDLFEEEKEAGNQNQPQHQTAQGRKQRQESIDEEPELQDQWNPIMETQRRNSINNGLPCQPSPQSQHQSLRHPEDDKIHSIHQAYSLNERAPSTISAISGISIPSCFPQDSPFGHLQQPLLVGGNSAFNGTYGGSSQVVSNTPITESTSFPSTASNINGGINLGLLNSPNFASNSSHNSFGKRSAPATTVFNDLNCSGVQRRM
jgi:hypothetical protein